MSDTLMIVIVLAALGVVFLAAAAPISAALVRLRASRLPTALALRMEEEWLGELNSISSRPGKFAFAVALLLTRRSAFVAPGEDIVRREIPAFGSRKSLVILSTLVFAMAAYGASFLVPVKYESTVTVQSEDIDNQVWMRARSSSLFKRVADEMQPGPPESQKAMIDDLRDNVTVDPVISSSLFVVKYRASDPSLAQKITAKLVECLIEQDFEMGFDKLSDEERFLSVQLKALAERVRDKDKELQIEGNTHASGGVLALDHELLVSSYKDLFAEHQAVKRAASLQKSRLRILDLGESARALAPNRAAYAGLGALAGFAMGGIAVIGIGRRQQRLLTKTI